MARSKLEWESWTKKTTTNKQICFKSQHKFFLFKYLIISYWKMVWPFIWAKLNPSHPMMVCAKFGWNCWLSGSWEEDENVKCWQTDRQTDRWTDRQTDKRKDDWQQGINKARLSFQRRWAKKEIKIKIFILKNSAKYFGIIQDHGAQCLWVNTFLLVLRDVISWVRFTMSLGKVTLS